MRAIFLFFGLFPICGRRIKFSISTFSGLVVLLSLLVSPSCLFSAPTRCFASSSQKKQGDKGKQTHTDKGMLQPYIYTSRLPGFARGEGCEEVKGGEGGMGGREGRAGGRGGMGRREGGREGGEGGEGREGGEGEGEGGEGEREGGRKGKEGREGGEGEGQTDKDFCSFI